IVWRSRRYGKKEAALSASIGGRYTAATRGYSSIGRALRSQCRGWGFESPYLHQSFLSSRPRPSTRALRFSEAVIQMSTSGPEAEGMAGGIKHDAKPIVVTIRRLVRGFGGAAFDCPGDGC